jgi:hypothetical protein
MQRAGVIKKRVVFIVSVLAFVVNASLCWSEDFHILSTGVQAFAIKNNILQKLATDHPRVKGPDRILLYLDVLAFADVVAFKRAEISKRGILNEDFNLAFSLECLLPFGPIHEKEKPKILELRPKLVENAFINKDKREKIENSINEQLIAIEKDSLMKQGIGLFQIMNVYKIIK